MTSNNSLGQAEPTSRLTIPFDHSISLEHALEISNFEGLPVVAYRIENDEVVGEYSVGGDVSMKEFEGQFYETYGTSPQIVGAIVEESKRGIERRAQRGEVGLGTLGTTSSRQVTPKSTLQIDTGLPEFIAPPASSKTSVRQRNDIEPTVQRVRSANRWEPDQAEIRVFDVGANGIYISQTYDWVSLDTSPDNLPDKYGIEFEVNAFSAAPVYQQTLTGRPYCGDTGEFYKAQPFAKNVNWSWSISVSDENGQLVPGAPTLGAYPDYNDLSDQCNRNSLAIGVADPWAIPLSGHIYSIQANILAPKGVETDGRISGVVQVVDRSYCQDTVPWMPLTDCMNVFPREWSGSGNNYRPTLSAGRDWTAPNRCWRSMDFGATTPVPFEC